MIRYKSILKEGEYPDILYHGSPSIIEKISFKMNTESIFWCSDNKKVSLQYSKEKYYKKSDYDYIYQIELNSGLKIADVTNENNKYFNIVKDWVNTYYRNKTGKDLTSEVFMQNYADFGIFEAYPNIIKFLKSKGVSLIKCFDKNYIEKHFSFGIIKLSAVKDIVLIDKIKR
jgi:hypothetical protein